MKIRSVKVFVFKYDHHYRLGGHTNAPGRLPGTDYYFEPQWKHAYSRLTESCLVKITTEDGIAGWGEGQAPLVPEVPATLIAKLFGPAIVGLDATHPAAIYDRLFHLSHVRGHTGSYTIDAMAAIDIALWDIKAKSEQKPLCELLSPEVNRRVPLYVSGLRRSETKERQEIAKEFIAQGFSGVKVLMGDGPEKTLNECAGIRSAIGAQAFLAFDAICAHSYADALAIGRGLDELSAAWFESPMDPQDVDLHAMLAKKINTPLAIGEPLRSVREFDPWIKAGSMKIAQPDIARCGITGSQRIIDRALKSGLRIAPHIGVCTSIGIAATWHIAATIKDPLAQEHQLDMFETANRVLKTPLATDRGHALVPNTPGLGIEADEEFMARQSSSRWLIDGNGVHYLTKDQALL